MTDDVSTNTLGHDLRRRRRELGLRQEELAGLAGTSARFIGALENGKPTVRLDKVLCVMDALGLQLRAHPQGETCP
ncbi:type II toxin-antitoxin system Y4mF family antitoxin [Spongisporangium articulatum]|uniref:Type II toxin-antitoxin system Y4mF family antitoxin n=1 Tax=Spongisporangium articulatum TaxID=3362603 RepID=A0ABW8AP76_9ACTN